MKFKFSASFITMSFEKRAGLKVKLSRRAFWIPLRERSIKPLSLNLNFEAKLNLNYRKSNFNICLIKNLVLVKFEFKLATNFKEIQIQRLSWPASIKYVYFIFATERKEKEAKYSLQFTEFTDFAHRLDGAWSLLCAKNPSPRCQFCLRELFEKFFVFLLNKMLWYWNSQHIIST